MGEIIEFRLPKPKQPNGKPYPNLDKESLATRFQEKFVLLRRGTKFENSQVIQEAKEACMEICTPEGLERAKLSVIEQERKLKLTLIRANILDEDRNLYRSLETCQEILKSEGEDAIITHLIEPMDWRQSPHIERLVDTGNSPSKKQFYYGLAQKVDYRFGAVIWQSEQRNRKALSPLGEKHWSLVIEKYQKAINRIINPSN
ncbi:MAG: hypothetical protein R3Y63_05975 [Eubacteriales bacterium]